MDFNTKYTMMRFKYSKVVDIKRFLSPGTWVRRMWPADLQTTRRRLLLWSSKIAEFLVGHWGHKNDSRILNLYQSHVSSQVLCVLHFLSISVAHPLTSFPSVYLHVHSKKLHTSNMHEQFKTRLLTAPQCHVSRPTIHHLKNHLLRIRLKDLISNTQL